MSGRARGFTMVELLTVTALVALLIGLLLPGLGMARDSARAVACLSNTRQLGAAWAMYAGDAGGRAMPLAYFTAEDRRRAGLDPSQTLYWFGLLEPASGGTAAFDAGPGLLSPYTGASRHESSVYECPSQRFGTYRPLGRTAEPTTTYGYNGYYLSPSRTPGWSFSIGRKPWPLVSSVIAPSRLLVFADTLLPTEGSRPASTPLLDPPRLYDASRWRTNQAPTTAFRHGGSAAAVTADGSAATHRAEPGWLVRPGQGIGSVGTEVDPRYVERPSAW